MRLPQTLSSEFPNDNPSLHQGASWLCLDPLAAARPVARPGALAKAGLTPAAPTSNPALAAAPAVTVAKVRSTLIPPASEETEQFVNRFIARLTTPADTKARASEDSFRFGPIAQFMLEELPAYRLRRSPSQVPPPPQHVYVQTVPAHAGVAAAPISEIREIRALAAVTLDFSEQACDSPLALVEAKFDAMDDNWLPVVLQPDAIERLATESSTVVATEVVAAEVAAPTAPTAAITESSEEDSYAQFLAALSEVLLQQGATRGAALIRLLLEEPRFEASALGETLGEQLAAAGIGSLRGDQFIVAEAVSQAASAWRAVLRGESSDFSCADTLDQWATGLLTALLPSDVPQKEIRKELRRRGVAAFGMLAAA